MNWTINQTVDLSRGYTPVVWPDALMVSGDVGAHTWRLTVLDNGVPADLSGATITGYFVREDGVTVAVAGTVLGNAASVVLAQNCYAVAGRLGGVLRMEVSDKTVTLSSVIFTVKRLTTDSMVDPGKAFYTTEVLSRLYDGLQAQIASLASGTPNGTYATLGDLTTDDPNHAHIYVVTADGKWYYWDGSAWAAGGVYQAHFDIDDTLSEAGKAADAKAVGDLKADKAAIERGFALNQNRQDLWEQGNINSLGNNGDPQGANNPINIRFKEFVVYSKSGKFVCQPGFEVYAVRKNAEGTVLDPTNPGYKPEILIEPGIQYRIQVRRTSMTAISTAIALSAIWIFGNGPDKTLTEEGFAPDSKIVGDYLDYIGTYRTDADAVVRGYKHNLNKPLLWEQGHFVLSTGEPGLSNAYQYPRSIRTKDFIPTDVECVTAVPPYQIQCLKYDLGGTFVEALPLERRTVLETGYRYKVQLQRSSGVVVTEFHGAGLLKSPLVISTMDKSRDVNFAVVPGSYYTGRHAQYDAGFGASTQTSDVETAFNALVDAHPDCMTKHDLGLCSDGVRRIYEYRLTQPVSTSVVKPMHPKILIIAAQHGFEKSSTFGLYYLLKDMLQNWHLDPVLEYLRFQTEIRIIPIVNPYGFTNSQYTNANGVNLNRNYDTEGWAPRTGDQYGGEAPFDQPEAAAVRDFVLANPDAVLFIDFHTFGSGVVDAFNKINWIPLRQLDDEYYHRLFDASEHHIRRITGRFNRDYNLGVTNELCGYTTGVKRYISPEYGYAPNWVCSQNIPALTFEGFNGFPGGIAHSPDVHKANSELLGNFLALALWHLRGTT